MLRSAAATPLFAADVATCRLRSFPSGFVGGVEELLEEFDERVDDAELSSACRGLFSEQAVVDNSGIVGEVAACWS